MLKISNLSFAFGRNTIFSDLNLIVSEGEVLHIKGDNGAGKTTLLKILAGLIKDYNGEFGFSFNSLNNKAQQDYLASEHNGFYLDLSATDNLAFWSQIYNQSSDIDLINKLLETWLHRTPHFIKSTPIKKYSTGMKRRTAIARLILCKRDCWLLDEPLLGLDDDAKKLLASALRNHIKSGGAALIVSHDQSIFEEFQHKTLTLNKNGYDYK